MSKVVMVAAPVHPVPPNHGAAVEWWAYQVSLRLPEFACVVVCTHADGYALSETVGDVRFYRIRIGRLYRRIFQKITRLDPRSYAHRAVRIIRAEKPDIVHVHNDPRLLSQLIRLTGTDRYRYILHMQNHMELPSLPARVPMIACSHALARWYEERFKAKVSVIWNGVDPGTYQPAWSDPGLVDDRRRSLGIPPDRKIVLYVGRLSPEKGPLDLVHAFRELLRHRSDVQLLLIGEARTGDPSNPRVRYASEIRAACEQMPEHCRLLGSIDPKAIHEFYVVADLLVVPSEFEEPFGMVAAEAMAAGIPVLAARRGGLVEFIREGETGFFIDDTKNRASFAARMSALLDAPDLRDAVRRRARDYVAVHHSWEELARQLRDVYRDVLATAHPSAERHA